MTKKILINLLLCFIITIASVTGQCNMENKVFQSDEQLEFTGYYQLGFIWLNFGKVKLTVRDTVFQEQPSYYVVGNARNAKAYDMFFRLRDTLSTVIAKEGLNPLLLDRRTHEGKYYARHIYQYDNTNQKIQSYITKNRGKTEHSVIPFEGCVNNLLSVLYYIRNIDYDKYKPGSNIPVQLVVDGKISKVYVRYHGVKKLRAKHCPRVLCYKVTPVMPKGGMFESGDGMYIWLTKDANKVPLLLEAEIPVGSVKGVLKRVDGLRHKKNVLGVISGEVER